MSIEYTAFDKNSDRGYEDGFPLTAKTDRGARMQAKKLAKEKGWKRYGLVFFRYSDGCRGEIDV
jgi:hypothetical protein